MPALLVVEDGKNTAEEDIRHSVQILEGTELVGIVLNKSR